MSRAMPTQAILAAAVLAVLGSPGSAIGQTAPTYTFQVIQVPGAGNTAAFDISNLEDIVGHYVDAGTGLLRGFSLTQGGFDLVDFPATGVVQTQALGVNAAGQIVGQWNQNGGAHGFLLENGTYTSIDVPGPSSSTYQATDVNNVGQIVGTWSDAIGWHGFLFEQGTFTPIDVPGATYTDANGINDAGDVVGTYYNATGGGHGYVMTQGAFQTLDFPSATTTEALGINGAGHVVGVYFDGSGRFHGFLWDGVAFSTVDVPGAFVTAARGINDQGQIVGNFLDGTGGHGFLATPETPASLIGGLVDDIDQLVGVELKSGQANGLTRPLANALRSLDAGRIAPACSQLDDFITEVLGKTPPLSVQTSDALIADANTIRARIGC